MYEINDWTENRHIVRIRWNLNIPDFTLYFRPHCALYFGPDTCHICTGYDQYLKCLDVQVLLDALVQDL